VTRGTLPPVVLRRGVTVADPRAVVLDFLAAYGPLEISDPSPAVFAASDLRRANGQGARISAAQKAAILKRRAAIEAALGTIAPAASLAGSARSVPWPALAQLFAAFADIPGVGLSKMTKALHSKRPALIPMLDSVVQAYLADDDLGGKAPFAPRAVGLVRGYRRDLDRNRAALRAVRRELAGRGQAVTEVRILDLVIWSARGAARSGAAAGHPVKSAVPSER
jgi:Family of unknown function (DUF6308)